MLTSSRMNSSHLLIAIIILLLAGCSFRADTPAPVVNVNSPVKKSYSKGGLTSDRYKVRKGDTLYSIAWAANKDFIDIARNNRLKEPFTIYPGQVLTLKLKKPVTKASKQKSNANSQSKVVSTKHKSDKKQNINSKPKPVAQKVTPSKKSLDQGHTSAYAVTSGKQVVNDVVHKPKAALPQKVYSWYWPVKGKLIGTFSATEQGNKGIKIAGSRGDRIQAAADGRVVYAGNALRGYGNLVIIKHSDDFLSAYAHADKILVKEKQFVTAGQTVASMGQTGTNKVMLHFEIRYHGKSVDPLRYLPKK